MTLSAIIAMSVSYLLEAIAIGVGATLCIDLWTILLRHVFKVPSLDYCLLGRWLLHMPAGRFVHDRIGDARVKPHECRVGWAAHYTIGVSFTIVFVLLVPGWLDDPTLIPALAFGVATVVVPFFTVQPGLGLGIASSRMPRPMPARLKSLATHAVFGVGLYICARVLNGE